MVSCEYIIVMVCAVNKLSLIQEEEKEEEIEFLIKGSFKKGQGLSYNVGRLFNVL